MSVSFRLLYPTLTSTRLPHPTFNPASNSSNRPWFLFYSSTVPKKMNFEAKAVSINIYYIGNRTTDQREKRKSGNLQPTRRTRTFEHYRDRCTGSSSFQHQPFLNQTSLPGIPFNRHSFPLFFLGLFWCFNQCFSSFLSCSKSLVLIDIYAYIVLTLFPPA
jgi:hypothetical protein